MANRPKPQAASAPPSPRVAGTSPGAAPRGQRIESNLGPGRLYPGVGKLVQRTGLPHRAGTITGLAFGYSQAPNTKNPQRISTRFAGQFMLIDHKGSVVQGAECYLPPTIERAVKAALDLRGQGSDPVPVSIECWCEPDQEGRPPSPIGYTWVGYDLSPRSESDPLMALAFASGVIERPATALPPPDLSAREGEEIDPETGEIRPATVAAA